jgi:peptidoglycan/xylan/chitin deacetylase (PgdA/CDA1 family)
MKALAGQAAALLARLGILDALEFVDRATDRVGILAYHRIDELADEPDLDPGLISATPADFRAQMEVVAAHYNAISLGELLDAHTTGRALAQRAVLLTFDDGYRDFAKIAWPILKSYGLPAVLFVPTSFPDSAGPGFWWDRLHSALVRTDEAQIEVEGIGSLPLGGESQRRAAHRVLRTHAKTLPHAEALAWIDALIERLAEVPPLHRVLGWDALRQMANEGLSVCSHGNLHALYTRLSASELMEDLLISKARIEAELGDAAPPPVIAYPAAASSPTVFHAARSAGYRIAFGGRRGIDRLPLSNPFDLMRIPVHRYGTALFRAQLRPGVSRLGSLLVDRRARVGS